MSDSRHESRDDDLQQLIHAAKTDKQAYTKLVETLTERVWHLWREELRVGQIRRGGSSRR